MSLLLLFGGATPATPNTMLGQFGGLTGTMTGTSYFSGVMTGNLGELTGSIVELVEQHYWDAQLQRSLWRADLEQPAHVADDQPSTWDADLN